MPVWMVSDRQRGGVVVVEIVLKVVCILKLRHKCILLFCYRQEYLRCQIISQLDHLAVSGCRLGWERLVLNVV